MNRLGVSLACALACASAPFRAMAEPGEAREIAEVVAALQKPDAIASRFVQTKTSPAFRKPQEARGRLWIAKPKRVRWEYESPFASTLVLDGERVTLHHPSFGAARTFDLDSDPGMRAVFDVIFFFTGASAAKVEETFLATIVHAPDMRLHLEPKSAAGRKVVRSIDVWVNVERGVLEKVRMRQADDSETEWRFVDAAVNPVLDAKLFQP